MATTLKLYRTDNYSTSIPEDAVGILSQVGRIGSHRQGTAWVTATSKTEALGYLKAAKVSIWAERELKLDKETRTRDGIIASGRLVTPGEVYVAPIDSSTLAEFRNGEWVYVGRQDTLNDNVLVTIDQYADLSQAISDVITVREGTNAGPTRDSLTTVILAAQTQQKYLLDVLNGKDRR